MSGAGPVIVEIKGLNELGAAFKKLIDEAPGQFGKAIASSLIMLQGDVVKELQRGERTGRVYYRGKIMHQASAPGEPPKSDSGYLAGHASFSVEPDGLSGSFFVNALYARWLEEGTKKMAARPYLQPIVDKDRAAIEALIRKAVDAALTQFKARAGA